MSSEFTVLSKFIGVLVLSAITFSILTLQVAKAEVPTNFKCFQVDDHNRRLGSVSIDCYLDLPWDENGISTNLEISSDGIKWKYVVPISKHVGGDAGPCLRNNKMVFDTSPSENFCYYLDLSYEPTKIGTIYLRAESNVSGASSTSNPIQFDVKTQLLSEQIENRKRSALNKYYKLKANWPDRLQVGTTKQLKVTSPEKYSGKCSIVSRPGGKIDFKFFDMKKGNGSVTLRGLKVGAIVVEIGCYQNNGGGPYANSKHTIYFY